MKNGDRRRQAPIPVQEDTTAEAQSYRNEGTLTTMAKKKTAARRSKKTKKKAAKPQTSTALARRSNVIDGEIVVTAPPGTFQALVDSPVLGDFALKELKLTAKEEKILARPVPIESIQIKPTGQPYLPHAGYRRWFAEAFGRMGWQLRPANNPMRAPAKSENAIQVVRGYLLYVHGEAVAYADGEHEYFTNNAEQSWGDAVEATQASALRRCAKHLNVGLELWDKSFIDKFKREHCIGYWVKYRDRRGNTNAKQHWMLKTDEAPKNIITMEEAMAIMNAAPVPDGQRRQAPKSAGSDGNGGMTISVAQSGRLWGMARDAGRDWDSVLAWLKKAYGAEDQGKGKAITLKRSDYQAVCDAIMAPGDLPSGKA